MTWRPEGSHLWRYFRSLPRPSSRVPRCLASEVTAAEWKLLWIAADISVALDGMKAKQRHAKTGV
jgi:hypothetical protein